MAKKKIINKSLRNAVWVSEFGSSGVGKCYCCRIEPISTGNFQCGHIVAEAKGGATILQNLKPICALCNTSMGTRDMREFALMNGYRPTCKSHGWCVCAVVSVATCAVTYLLYAVVPAYNVYAAPAKSYWAFW